MRITIEWERKKFPTNTKLSKKAALTQAKKAVAWAKANGDIAREEKFTRIARMRKKEVEAS